MIVAFFAFILFAVLVLALSAYTVFCYGVLTYYFYLWFITPVFTTLPHLTFLQAIGIAMFLNLFKNMEYLSSIKSEYIDTKKEKNNVITKLIYPWIALILGYVVHLYIN